MWDKDYTEGWPWWQQPQTESASNQKRRMEAEVREASTGGSPDVSTSEKEEKNKEEKEKEEKED